ncbi:MAG: polysaccharide deacetylase family protein, partial [Clostridia bacterium]|nr:polysaccharide deacetylase family protein [Clostridia bacterium]
MKTSKKIQIIINAVLFITVAVVGVVAFIPEKSVTISGGNGATAIYNGDRNSNLVALTFNVYENTEVVNGILDTLKSENVKATFFVGGCWADDNENTLKRIINEGHELGNHGYYHKDHKKLDKEGNVNEISACGRIVFALTGYQTRLFAPPSGSYNKTTLTVANELGYQTIMWSKDTIDWRD